MIVLGIEAPEHPPFLLAGELRQVELAPGAGEDAGTFDAEHAPLAVTGLEQGLQLALGVAPVEEFIDQLAVDLARAVVAHPDFLELAQAQEQAEIGDILPVVFGRVGGDEPVVARLADDELPDQRSEQAHRRGGGVRDKRRQANGRAQRVSALASTARRTSGPPRARTAPCRCSGSVRKRDQPSHRPSWFMLPRTL